jgi:DNA-binding SARP family transcriptional activator
MRKTTEKMGSEPYIRVQLLGPFRVWIAGEEFLKWRSERARALFAYLLLKSDQDVPRTLLSDLIWFDDPPEGKRAWKPENRRKNLSRELCEFRKLFQKSSSEGILFLTRHGSVRLVSHRITTDYGDFRQLYSQSQAAGKREEVIAALKTALGFARERGALLSDIGDAWALDERRAFEQEVEALDQRLLALEGDTPPNETASERLALEARRNRHRQLERLRDAWDRLHSPDQVQLFHELDDERFGLLYLAEWETRQNAIPRILTDVTVRIIWQRTGLHRYVIEILRHNLEARNCVPEIPRPYVQSVIGSIAVESGQCRLALRYLKRALKEFKRRNDIGCIAGTLAQLTTAANYLGNYDEALEHAEEALLIYRELDDLRIVSMNLEAQARIQRSKGDLPKAIARMKEAMLYARQADDRLLVVREGKELADALWHIGQRDAAYRQIEELEREMDPQFYISICHVLMVKAGWKAEEGEFSETVALLRKSLEACAAGALWLEYTVCLRHLFECWLGYKASLSPETPDLLARLVGAESAQRQKHQQSLPEPHPSMLNEVRARLREALGREAYRVSVRAGQSLSLDEILSLMQVLSDAC